VNLHEEEDDLVAGAFGQIGLVERAQEKIEGLLWAGSNYLPEAFSYFLLFSLFFFYVFVI
jgi:hypothetical protein